MTSSPAVGDAATSKRTQLQRTIRPEPGSVRYGARAVDPVSRVAIHSRQISPHHVHGVVSLTLTFVFSLVGGSVEKLRQPEALRASRKGRRDAPRGHDHH